MNDQKHSKKQMRCFENCKKLHQQKQGILHHNGPKYNTKFYSIHMLENNSRRNFARGKQEARPYTEEAKQGQHGIQILRIRTIQQLNNY